MNELSAAGRQAVHDIADRHHFSPEAVSSMLESIVAGRGRMAQFHHREFGGAGQWMRGGMTMISDLFDAPLKARVERLCDELSRLIADEPDLLASDLARAPDEAVARGARWWPDDLGSADSTGSQNGMRYAFFARARRLAIDKGGRVVLYDTLDHDITGVAQQQSGRGSLTFTGQHGVVDVESLPILLGDSPSVSAAEPDAPPQTDIVATIEKLAELQRKGILSADEFAAKKTQLLGRL